MNKTETRLAQIHAANELGLTRKQAAMNLRMDVTTINNIIRKEGIEWNNKRQWNDRQREARNERDASPVNFPFRTPPVGSLFDFHPND